MGSAMFCPSLVGDWLAPGRCFRIGLARMEYSTAPVAPAFCVSPSPVVFNRNLGFPASLRGLSRLPLPDK